MLHSYFQWIDAHLAKPPEAVSFEEIRLYLAYLKQDKKLDNRSINAHISQLAFLHRYVLHMPWDKYEVPFKKFNSKLPHVLTQKQAHCFINSITDLRQKACVALLYSAGLRVSEVRHLKPADIHRKDMRLYISCSKSRSDRYAVLSKKALDILTRYWYTYRPKEWLFPGRDPSKPVSGTCIGSFIAKHKRYLNWDTPVTAHTFRHSFGTHLYEQGYDLVKIQKLLGHKSISSTLLYVHLSTRSISEIVSPFDREVDT